MSGDRPVRVLVNPRAGRGAGLRHDGPPGVEWVETTSENELSNAVDDAVRSGHERVVVVGGDGTIHRAVTRLARSRCGLGIVPAGTGNDLARSLGLPRDPAQALRTALAAPLRPIDIGHVDDRPFSCIAGVGLDGAVAAFVNERLTRLRGRWVYPYATVRTVFGFRTPGVALEIDEGRRREGPFLLTAFANTPRYGGGMRVAPDALTNDGMLDLVIVRDAPRVRLLPLLARVYRGTHVTHPLVEVLRIREARIRVDRPIDVWADGERLQSIPRDGCCVGVWPGALLVAHG